MKNHKKAILTILTCIIALAVTFYVVSLFQKNCSIEGKWQNVGKTSFGQLHSGSIMVADGTYCNLYSPKDSYVFTKDNDGYTLETYSYLFGEKTTFNAKFVKEQGEEYLVLEGSSTYLILKRIK